MSYVVLDRKFEIDLLRLVGLSGLVGSVDATIRSENQSLKSGFDRLPRPGDFSFKLQV